MNEYVIPRATDLKAGSQLFDDGSWQGVDSQTLTHVMPGSGRHRPTTRFKLAWDNAGLRVTFQVEDRYVHAATTENQGPVCNDSCVECFFIPGDDVTKGYFNLEINCLGVALFHFQTLPRQNPVRVLPPDAFDGLQIKTSLTAPLPDAEENSVWSIACHIPFSVLEKHFSFGKPEAGNVWRANFYKCADSCGHPHWLTWAHVESERPDFHRPDSFGRLVFA